MLAFWLWLAAVIAAYGWVIHRRIEMKRNQSHEFNPAEFKVVRLRDCLCRGFSAATDPHVAEKYWRKHVTSSAYFNPEVECLIGLALDTRLNIMGHFLIGVGSVDSVICNPRECYRPAIVMSASKLILMHNHPSGDSTPSQADITATKQLIKAGKILGIELLDHVIIGRSSCSLREYGYFYETKTKTTRSKVRSTRSVRAGDSFDF